MHLIQPIWGGIYYFWYSSHLLLLIKLLYDAAEYRLWFLIAESILSPDPATNSNLFKLWKRKSKFFLSLSGAIKALLLWHCLKSQHLSFENLVLCYLIHKSVLNSLAKSYSNDSDDEALPYFNQIDVGKKLYKCQRQENKSQYQLKEDCDWQKQ